MVVHIVWVANWIVENILAIWLGLYTLNPLQRSLPRGNLMDERKLLTAFFMQAMRTNRVIKYLYPQQEVVRPTFLATSGNWAHHHGFPSRLLHTSNYYPPHFSCHQVGNDERNMHLALKGVLCKWVSAPNFSWRPILHINTRFHPSSSGTRMSILGIWYNPNGNTQNQKCSPDHLEFYSGSTTRFPRSAALFRSDQ